MASDFSHSFSYQKFLTGPRPPRSDSVEPHHIGRNSIILYEVDPDHYCRFENGAQNSPPLYTPPESLRRSALRESREEFRRIKPELYKLCLECRRLHLDADDNRRGSDNSSQNTSEEDLHTDSDSSNAPEISGSNREENREGNREEKGGEKGEETHSHTSGFSSSSSFSQSSGSSSFSQSSSSSCSCQSATRRSTVRSLLQSSNAGCHLCTLIAGALASTYGRRWLEDMSESSFFVFIDASTSTLKIVCENNVVSLSIADVPPDFSRVKHHSELFYPATMTLQQISAPLPDNCYTVMDSHTAARTLVSPGGNMYNEVKPKCGSKRVYVSWYTWRELSEVITPRTVIILEERTEEGTRSRWEEEAEPSRRYMEMLPSKFDSYYLEPPHPYCSCGEGLWEAPLLRNGDTSYLHHSPVAPALIKQIKYWMATCDKHHPDCKLEDGAIRSLRLIDVGPPNGKHQPRLKDKLSEGRKYKYITLSYRWGDPSSDMLTTTSETLEERKAGIPMDILPKTMRDAVVITRKLGIRYLWIDALCILQDSRTDWEEQSANMADIYSKATLSISAHEADDAHSGFLWFRDPLESRGCIHPSLAQGRPVVICPKLIDPEEGIAHSIISQRGWTLQEQILPHRILHWGPHEVSWECRTMRASERRPIGEKKRSRFSFSENSAASMELRHDWVGLIENYSRRRLTKPTDKLPAIAGLACSFHQLFSPPPTYLAGLWYEMAVPYLGWHTDMVWNCTRNRTSSGGSVVPDSTCEMHSNMPETSRTPAYPVRMPAFSWVSTDCPIKWAMWAPNAADKYMAETVSHSVKLAGQSRFGAVESSSLTLRGYVKPLRFSEYIANKLYDRFQVYLDRDDVDLEYLEKDCILFHLFCTATQPFHRCSRGWGRETVSQHSLILLREVSKGPDVFRRIGLVRKNFHGGGGPQEVPHSAYTDIEAEFGDWTKTVIVLI